MTRESSRRSLLSPSISHRSTLSETCLRERPLLALLSPLLPTKQITEKLLLEERLPSRKGGQNGAVSLMVKQNP